MDLEKSTICYDLIISHCNAQVLLCSWCLGTLLPKIFIYIQDPAYATAPL